MVVQENKDLITITFSKKIGAKNVQFLLDYLSIKEKAKEKPVSQKKS